MHHTSSAVGRQKHRGPISRCLKSLVMESVVSLSRTNPSGTSRQGIRCRGGRSYPKPRQVQRFCSRGAIAKPMITEERFSYQRVYSAPVTEDLKRWCEPGGEIPPTFHLDDFILPPEGPLLVLSELHFPRCPSIRSTPLIINTQGSRKNA